MTPLPSGKRSSQPSLRFEGETPLVNKLFAEARPIVARLLRAIQPDVIWKGDAPRVSTGGSRTNLRVTVIRYLDEDALGGSLDRAVLMTAAQAWFKVHGFKIILDQEHGDTKTLIAGNTVVGFKITSQPALFRVQASSQCFPRPQP